ncbi:helix-turn-helix domain-containing protein [Tepidiforma thermophila]|uniref:Excisionase family DNA binding protein n=1 Tax=Tepidiforma thermophila (strain KCTC 52669 / CGMCC 1.13589 / G233) TaxID=2761530 RepID=A0A2A9HKB1_TEPT2|nr:helix-turn-helix domain-containing protein [Tepidiforma thermophila]PFG75309.1 excisionase family DNA binding protein [Tepidiforma thermophila]
MGPKLAYSIAEAAQALGIGRTLAIKLVRSGQLRSIKVGRRRLVPAAALEELLQQGAPDGR